MATTLSDEIVASYLEFLERAHAAAPTLVPRATIAAELEILSRSLPRDPLIRTPLIRESTIASNNAVLRESCPTTAVNGNVAIELWLQLVYLQRVMVTVNLVAVNEHMPAKKFVCRIWVKEQLILILVKFAL